MSRRTPRVLAEVLEAAYAGVYLLIPLALLAREAFLPSPDPDGFWAVVLITDFVCFGVLPWVQTRPPRALEPGEPWASSVRRFNLRLLGATSIQVNTFPSGHAAEALAAFLLVLAAPAGVVFLMFLAALAVSAGAVLGRYHFLADAVAGWVVAVGVFLIVYLIPDSVCISQCCAGPHPRQLSRGDFAPRSGRRRCRLCQHYLARGVPPPLALARRLRASLGPQRCCLVSISVCRGAPPPRPASARSLAPVVTGDTCLGRLAPASWSNIPAVTRRSSSCPERSPFPRRCRRRDFCFGGPGDLRFVRARSRPDGGTCAGGADTTAGGRGRAHAGAQPPVRRGTRTVQDARHSRRHAHRWHRCSSPGSGRHRRLRQPHRVGAERGYAWPGAPDESRAADERPRARRDRDVRDAGIRRHARARGRRAEEC